MWFNSIFRTLHTLKIALDALVTCSSPTALRQTELALRSKLAESAFHQTDEHTSFSSFDWKNREENAEEKYKKIKFSFFVNFK